MKDTKETEFVIGASEACRACKSEATLGENLIAAMRAMKDHWLVVNDERQFLCAVGGVMEFYGPDSDEYARLEREVRNMLRLASMLTALQQGVPVDIESMLEQVENENADGFKPLGLQKMWQDLNQSRVGTLQKGSTDEGGRKTDEVERWWKENMGTGYGLDKADVRAAWQAACAAQRERDCLILCDCCRGERGYEQIAQINENGHWAHKSLNGNHWLMCKAATLREQPPMPQSQSAPGYMGDVNGPGCDPDVP